MLKSNSTNERSYLFCLHESMSSDSDSYVDSESDDYDEDSFAEGEQSGKRKRGKTSKKKRPKKKSRFSLIDDAAEESEEDEEDLQRQREKQQREDENESQEVKNLRASMDARFQERMKARKILQNVSMEDQVQDIKERERQRRRDAKRWRKQMGNRTQRERHMPTPNDPKLFSVKCKTGSERLLTLQLMNKYRAMAKKKKNPRIFSATSNKTKGYIYVEAYNKDDVVNFVLGIQGLYPSQTDMTPLNEMTSIFNIVRKTSTLKVGQWVRMKNGAYRGDLARVETRPNARGQVVIRLIPRLDYSENQIPKHIYMKSYLKGELNEKLRQVKEVNPYMAEKINDCLDNLEMDNVSLKWAKKQIYDDSDHQIKTLESLWVKGENKYKAERLHSKNHGSRPEQKFFDLKEVENAFGQLHHDDKMARMEQMENSKITFVKFRKGYYRQGFLFKPRVNVGAVDQEIKPSLEELQQFRARLNVERSEEGRGSDDDEDDERNVQDSIGRTIAADLKHAKGGMEKSIPFEVGDTARVTSSDLKNAYVKIVKIEPNERKAFVKVLSDSAEFWIELDNLEKHFRVGMRIKVIHGVHMGEVGYIQHINTEGNLVEATVTDVRYTKEFKVFVKDIEESNEKAIERSSLAGYDLYDLVQVGVGGKRGVIVRCGHESFLVIGTDGTVSTVTPPELSRKMNNISKRGQVIDKQGQYVSVGDFAIIMEGKNKGKLGKVMHISNATVFLHSRDNVEHAGIFVAKSNTLQLAGYKSQQDLTELSRGMISRDSTVGGKAHISMKRSGAMNLNKRPEREKKDLDIGKTMQITQGNWKGMIGIVVDGTETHRTIELHSKNKTVTVLKSRCLEVTNDRSGKIVERNIDSMMTPGTGYTGSLGSNTPSMTPGLYTPGMFGAGGITPGMPGGGLGGATPMLGGITPMNAGNDGDWDTPAMQTPAMQTPAPSSVHHDDMVSTDMGSSVYSDGRSFGGPAQQPGWGNSAPPAPQSWAGNSSINSSAYNQGPPSYQHGASSYGAPSTTGVPTPSEYGGSSYNNSHLYGAGYNTNPTPLSTGGATPGGLQTPMSLAGGDDVGSSVGGIWNPARTPTDYSGVMVTLKNGKTGVIKDSILGRLYHHNVLLDDGQTIVVHEKDVALVKPEKGDEVVILQSEDKDVTKRGKVQSVEGSDYVIEFTGAGGCYRH